MSLRVRLISSIIVVLLVSLCLGAAVAGRHAIRSVRVEMQAALAVGVQTLRNGIENIPQVHDPDAELRRLVHTFDGDRHISAILRDSAEQVRVASTPAASGLKVPAWFIVLLAPSIAPARLDVAGGKAITVEADPHNEISEVWTQFRDDLIAVGVSCGLSLLLVSLVVSRALRPLDQLSAALASVGSGEYAVRVELAGPPEIGHLAQGFNAMVARLDAAQARNFRLNKQLLALQEEERADLARDLHDEVGPFLFAVNLDAASITQLAISGRITEVQERASAIREAVEHMQRHVRAMLHRLRPAGPVDAGLTSALGNLLALWRARQPEIEFALDIAVDEDSLSDAAIATIYRLVQEGVNNAVRHGHPNQIEIILVAEDDCEVIVHIADDGTGFPVPAKLGFGVMGMRERVERLGGMLRVGAGENGKGVVITAKLPIAVAATESA